MAKAISVDLRERACEAVSEGLSRHQAAARFKVSPSSVIRWMARLKTNGDIAPNRKVETANPAELELKPGSSSAWSKRRPTSRLPNCRLS